MPLSNDYLLEFSTSTFVFSSATKVETMLIEKLQAYTNRLKQRGVFKDDIGDVIYNAAFNKDLAKHHQITVECIPGLLIPVSFGNNVGTGEDVRGDTWKIFQGKWRYAVTFTIRSMNRYTVARLADIVLLGLLKPVNDALLEIGIEIPINNMSLDRITPDKEAGYENLFRLTLQLPEIFVDWIQVYREDGVIAEEIAAEIIRGE